MSTQAATFGPARPHCRSVRTGAAAQRRDHPIAHLPTSDPRNDRCQVCGYFHTEPTYRSVI